MRLARLANRMAPYMPRRWLASRAVAKFRARCAECAAEPPGRPWQAELARLQARHQSHHPSHA